MYRTMRKSVAVLLTMVLLLSGVVPVYAAPDVEESCVPCKSYEIVEGEAYDEDGNFHIDEIMTMTNEPGVKVFVEEYEYEEGCGSKYTLDDVAYFELLTTQYYPATDTYYELVVVKKYKYSPSIFKYKKLYDVKLYVRENEAPEAADYYLTCNEEASIEENIMAGCQDDDHDTLSFVGFTDASGDPINDLNGFSIDGDIMTYTAPDEVSESGPPEVAEIYYKITDNDYLNEKTDIGFISVTLNPVNDLPVFTGPIELDVVEGSSVTIDWQSFMDDEDSNIAVLDESSMSPNYGTVVGNVYTPQTGLNLPIIDTFSLSVTQNGESITTSVYINILSTEPTNNIIVDDDFTGSPIYPGDTDELNVKINDTILNGFTGIEVSPGQYGTTTPHSNNDEYSIGYQANTGINFGEGNHVIDTFTYTIYDDDLGSLTANVAVRINKPEPVYILPEANDFSVLLSEGCQGAVIDYLPHISYDELLTIELVQAHNSSQGNAYVENYILYYTHTAAPDLTPDQITYVIRDSQGAEASGVITVNFTDEPNALEVNDDTVIGLSNTSIPVNVLDNDLITNGIQSLTIETNGEHGMAIVNNNNSVENASDDWIEYHSDPNFGGIDTIKYKVVDLDEQVAYGYITIDVRLNYDQPILHTDYLFMNQGESATVDLFLNDFIGISDFGDMIEEVYVDTVPENGTINLNFMPLKDKCLFTFNANNDTTSYEMIWYKVKLKDGTIYQQQVFIGFYDVNRIKLVNDIVTMYEDSDFIVLDLLENDIIEKNINDIGILEYEALDGPFHGQAKYENNEFSYKPDVGYVGEDTFRYFIIDEDGLVSVAACHITVEKIARDPYDLEDYSGLVDSDATFEQVVLDQSFPNYFDMGSLEIDATLNAPFSNSNGLVYCGSNSVYYDPLDMTNVEITYTVTDQYDHVGIGTINVIVIENSTLAAIYAPNTPLRVNQYAGPDAIRNDVTYVPSVDLNNVPSAIVKKYEQVTKVVDEYPEGYYPANIKDDEGYPLSITYFFGEFDVTYKMVDGNNEKPSSQIRRVSINAQPKVSLYNDIDPMAVNLPGNAVIYSESLESIVVDVNYADPGFDILSYVYGYDHEDLQEIMTLNGATIGGTGNVNVEFFINGEAVAYPIDELWQHLLVTVPDGFNPEEDEPIVFTPYTIQFKLVDTEGFASEISQPMVLNVYNNLPTMTIPTPVNYEVNGTPYITLGTPYDLWTGIDGVEDDITYYDVEDAYYQPFAVERVTVYKWNGLFFEELGIGQSVFDSSGAGYYRFDYLIVDYHGESVSGERFLEVNTPPTVSYTGAPIVLQLDTENPSTYPVWDGVTYTDDDLDEVSIYHKIEKLVDGEYVLVSEATFGPTELGNAPNVMMPIDVAGTYYITYRVEDVWMASQTIERVKEVIVNEPPQLSLDDDVVLLFERGVDDPEIFTTLQGVTVNDVEDSALGLLNDITVEATIEVIGIETAEASTNTVDEIDTTISGVYQITYTIEDSMGGTDSIVRYVSVFEKPVVTLASTTDQVETGGLYPVWNGVEVDFYDYNQLSFVDTSDIYYDLRAYLGDIEDDVLLDASYRFLENGTYTINYEVEMTVTDEMFLASSEEEPLTTTLTFAREVVVDNTAMDDIVYVNDIHDAGITFRNSLKARHYPVIVKVNTETGEERILTAYDIYANNQVSTEISTFDILQGFDDIAITHDGILYGLDDYYLYKLNLDGTVEEIECPMCMAEIALDYDFHDINYQSLTCNEDDQLVIMLEMPYDPYAPEGSTQYKNVLLYFDPSQENAPLVGISFVDYPHEAPFEAITDIAYDKDLDKIFGIAGDVIGTQGTQYFSGTDENHYTLFALESYTPETPLNWLVPIPENIAVKHYQLSSAYELPLEYRYKGLATHDNEVLVTRYGMMDDSHVLYFEYEDSFVPIMDGETQKMLPIQYGFGQGTGAASTYEMNYSLTANPTTIDTGASSQLTLTITPANAYDEVVWTTNGAGEIENVSEANGVVVVRYQSLSNTPENVTITASVDGVEQSVQIVVKTPNLIINNTRSVRVKLDADYVTLAYGGTVDPADTFYDFTETVTGTSDKRVTWSLDSDEYATIDDEGIIRIKEGIAPETGDITVEVKVTTVDEKKSATATVIFVETTPLGAVDFYDPYIAGYPDGSFRPSHFVTRAEVASMFARILSLDLNSDAEPIFTDVSKSHWAYAQIQALFNTGIFSGYLDDDNVRTFDPEASISRAEIAQVFTNYWKYLDISVTSEEKVDIPDVTDDLWAAPAIHKIYNTGIFTGYEDGSFKPFEATLREQIVMMINNLIDRPENSPETSKFNDISPNHIHYGDIEAASQTFSKPQEQ